MCFFFLFFLFKIKQEIRDMLNARGLKSSSVTLSPCGSGPNWARAAPVNAESQPDFWEEWKQLCIRDKLDACTIRGHKISLSPSPTENLLCVARLPRDLLDDEFKELVSSYGPVRRCFLLYSDKTGWHFFLHPFQLKFIFSFDEMKKKIIKNFEKCTVSFSIDLTHI
jgi:hypothetical protein